MTLRTAFLSPLSLACTTFVVAGSIGLYFIHQDSVRHHAESRALVLQQAGDARAALEQGINSRLNLLYALEGMVLALPRIDEATFQHIAGRMGQSFRSIREVELAPDAVIRFVYPAGDPDRLIGLDLRSIPGQKEAVEHAIMSGELILAGPVSLVQGGTGLIGRYPIYLGQGPERRFWGFATVVFDFNKLMQTLLPSGHHGLDIALRGVEGAGTNHAVFYGPADVFTDSPVLADITFPNGRWQLGARPQGGWSALPPEYPWLCAVAFLVAAISALGAFFVRSRYIGFSEIQRLHQRAGMLNADLTEKTRQLQALLDTAAVGITFVRYRRQLWANRRMAEMFGYSQEEMNGIETRAFYRSQEDYDDIGTQAYAAMMEGSLFRTDVRMRRKDGRLLWVRLAGRAVKPDDPDQGSIWVLEDITAAKEYQRTLEHDAWHDALTGLPNRTLFLDRLQQAILNARRRDHSLLVVFMDFDGFKSINDRFGHAVGDRVLAESAQRMKRVLREGDTLARQAGDEFLAVLLDTHGREDSEHVLRRLLEVAAEPYHFPGGEASVTVSIGVVEYPKCTASAEELIRHADEAMYSAKASGKNRYAFYHPS